MKDLPTPEELARYIKQHGVSTPYQNRVWLRQKLRAVLGDLSVIEGVGGSVEVSAEEDDRVLRARFCALVEAASALLQKAENVLYGGH